MMNKNENKKIVIVGPVYPFKGGIAHYTGLMNRALSKEYGVEMVSYSMQYPKLLFKKEQRDWENETFKIDGTNYWINTANPFSCVASAKKINKLNPDIVIIQWWHPYFAPCYWLLCKSLKKNIKVFFVCHNVFPHERFVMDRQLTKMVLKRGDGYIVHSDLDKTDLLGIKPSANVIKTFHPTYNAFKIRDLTKDEARKEIGLNLNEKVLLFFGFVREYKGLKWLIKAMPMLLEKYSDFKLMVVGDFGDDKEEYLRLIDENNAKGNVIIYDGYIPDNEVEKYFAASDMVVCPYESATQSGIVQIAYGFEKTVLVTNVGGLPEVVENGKTGYVVESKNPEQLADKILDYYEKEREIEFHNNIVEEAYKFSWDRMIEVVGKLDDGI